MKKILLLPTILFPYMVCLCLQYGFIARNFSDTTIKVLAILALVTLSLACVCNFIYMFSARRTPAEDLLKTALFIKAMHIPTYILIFIFGFIMGLMFFMTFPFIMLLLIIDLLTLWISGMISMYSIAKSLKEDALCTKSLLVVAMICQLFFCADIISLFVVKNTIKRKRNIL